MKNKEVIVFLVIGLMLATPVVSADNFLTGFSFFEDVGGFLSNVLDTVKSIFVKEIVSGVDEVECLEQEGHCRHSCEEGEYSTNQYSCEGYEENGNEDDDTGVATTLSGGVVYITGRGMGGDAGIEWICCLKIECGNERIDPGEECDDGNDNDIDECSNECKTTFCGDGIKNRNERCDGTSLGGQTCSSLYFSGGTLACTDECRYDTSGCTGRQSDIKCTGKNRREFNEGEEESWSCRVGEGVCERTGTKTRICRDDGRERGEWSEFSTCNVTAGEPTETPERTCNDNLDNDCDGLTDIEDLEDCIESECDDGLDNDNDGIIDCLDLDCKEEEECGSLRITGIETTDDEFYQYSKIPIVDCYYEITPSVNPQNVIQCINLTLDEVDMNCQLKTAQQIAEESAIRFRNCDVNTEIGEEKKLLCSSISKCNNDGSFADLSIDVIEYSTCEDGQQSPESIGNLRIREPDNNEEFEVGEEIEIEVKVQNNYINEDGEREDIDIVIVASLVDIIEWEEIEISDSIEKEVERLEEETFELNLTIPADLEEGNYRLYVKAYKSRDEDEICKSVSKNIKIIEPDDDDEEECEDDSDCNRGFQCTDETCTRLNCNYPLIISQDGHSCVMDDDLGAGDNGNGGIGGGEERDDKDEDGDGLPDWWEFNHFNNLNQGPYDDPDGDGIPNIDEFRFNKDPNKPDKSSLLWLWIVLGIIVVAAIVFFAFKLLKKPRRLSSSYSLNQPNQNKIQQFVQQAKAKGMKKQQIKNALLNAGWKEKDINKFL